MISPGSQGGPNIALITIACGWAFVGIALLGVSVLIWARHLKKIGLGLDDYLTIVALATSIALIAQTTWAIVDEGQDDHEAEVSRTKFALVVRVGLCSPTALYFGYLHDRQSLLVNQTLWGVANTLVRMSAILLIEKIFRTVQVRFIARSLLVVSILYGLVVLLEVFLICRPMAVDWNVHVDGTCGNQIVSYLVLEVLGLLLDSMVLIAPLPCIWRLQLPFKSKIQLSIVFSVGVLWVLFDPGTSMCADS